MRAIRILREEHRVLGQILQCLEALADGIVRTGSLDEGAARQTLDLLEGFADGCHQDKEEGLINRAAPLACDRVRSRLSCLEQLHDEERALLTELRQQLDRALGGDSWGFDLFVARAREYAKLQRRHSETEDRELFPLLEKLLQNLDEAELLSAFESVDQRWLESSRPPSEVAAALCDRVGIAVCS